MGLVLIAIILAVVGVLVYMFLPKQINHSKIIRIGVVSGCCCLSVLLLISTSFVIIDPNKVGHLKRIYGGSALPAGRVLALPGEKGPQARILGPGFKFEFLLNVLYDVEQLDMVTVPKGHYAILTAKDGAPLRDGQYIADAWPEGEEALMLDAVYAMGGDLEDDIRSPRIQKGPQLTVLTPAEYRINRYLFNVDTNHKALSVEAGYVAVIKSNVQENMDAGPILNDDLEGLSVPLVEKGAIGIWNEPVMPGTWYLNEMAYQHTMVPTRVQTFSYEGGYLKSSIDLDVDQEGNITQNRISDDIVTPETAADTAVFCKVEGWSVPQELRILVQIDPEDAPFVVASVGGILEAENNIVTPAVRSVVRNVIGRAVDEFDIEQSEVDTSEVDTSAEELGTKVLDLIERRSELEDKIETELSPEIYKAGINLKEVRLAEPAIPPELLVARLRAQLADQLIAAYQKEELAQEERKNVKNAQAFANSQDQLVQVEVDATNAEKRKSQLKSEGEGQKLRDQEIALGQKALVAVLGEDRVMQIEMLKLILDAATENPDIVKVSNVVVGGNSSGLEGAAAILGNSNLLQGLTVTQK